MTDAPHFPTIPTWARGVVHTDDPRTVHSNGRIMHLSMIAFASWRGEAPPDAEEPTLKHEPYLRAINTPAEKSALIPRSSVAGWLLDLEKHEIRRNEDMAESATYEEAYGEDGDEDVDISAFMPTVATCNFLGATFDTQNLRWFVGALPAEWISWGSVPQTVGHLLIARWGEDGECAGLMSCRPGDEPWASFALSEWAP